MNWQKQKPELKEECVIITANKIRNGWDYAIWEISETDGGDGLYLTVLTGDGDEWGTIEELQADYYMKLPKLK